MEAERKRQSDQLMKRMIQKSIKTQQQSSPKTPVQQKQKSTQSVKKERTAQRRPMILVMDQLKRSGASELVYMAPEMIVQTIEEEGGGGGKTLRGYLEKKSLQPLWSLQENAVRFAKDREADVGGMETRGYMLCDEMGLGKSRTLLSIVLEQNQATARESGKRFNGATLIVCKDLLIDNWIRELERFPSQTFYYHILTSSRDEADELDVIHLSHCCDIVFTTYATVSSDFGKEVTHKRRSLLFGTEWRRVVADEAHIMVNESTELSQTMNALSAKSKVIISGTPTQNRRERDILTLMRFIGYPENRLTTTMTTKEISHLLSILMIRRMKSDLHSLSSTHLGDITTRIKSGPTLISVSRHIEFVQFSTKPEKLLYYMYAAMALQRKSTSTNLSRLNVTHILGIMKQLCISPALVQNLLLPDSLIPIGAKGTKSGGGSIDNFIKIPESDRFRLVYREGDAYRKEGAEEVESNVVEFEWDNQGSRDADEREFEEELLRHTDWSQPPRSLLERDSSERRAALSRVLDRVIRFDRPFSKEKAVIRFVRNTPIDDKIVIFTLQTLTLHRLSRFLSEQNYKSVSVIGDTKDKNTALIEKFRHDPEIKVIFSTLKMGGEGISIPEANYVLVMDDWWNPFVLDQAESRVLREGQKKSVSIHYFIMDHTIEVYILNLMKKKKLYLNQLCPEEGGGGGGGGGENDDIIIPPLEEEDIDQKTKGLLFDYEVHLIPI